MRRTATPARRGNSWTRICAADLRRARSPGVTRRVRCPAPAARCFNSYLTKMVFARLNHFSIVQVPNFERWPIFGTCVWPNRVVAGSCDGEVITMNLWLHDCLRRMNGAIGR